MSRGEKVVDKYLKVLFQQLATGLKSLLIAGKTFEIHGYGLWNRILEILHLVSVGRYKIELYWLYALLTRFRLVFFVKWQLISIVSQAIVFRAENIIILVKSYDAKLQTEK